MVSDETTLKMIGLVILVGVLPWIIFDMVGWGVPLFFDLGLLIGLLIMSFGVD